MYEIWNAECAPLQPVEAEDLEGVRPLRGPRFGALNCQEIPGHCPQHILLFRVVEVHV